MTFGPSLSTLAWLASATPPRSQPAPELGGHRLQAQAGCGGRRQVQCRCRARPRNAKAPGGSTGRLAACRTRDPAGLGFCWGLAGCWGSWPGRFPW